MNTGIDEMINEVGEYLTHDRAVGRNWGHKIGKDTAQG